MWTIIFISLHFDVRDIDIKTTKKWYFFLISFSSPLHYISGIKQTHLHLQGSHSSLNYLITCLANFFPQGDSYFLSKWEYLWENIFTSLLLVLWLICDMLCFLFHFACFIGKYILTFVEDECYMYKNVMF